MSRDYTREEYELERQHEIERRLEIAAEQEPAWESPHRSRHGGRNRPGPERRYFSRLMFNPVRDPSEAIAIDEAA
jgi:hypothetical protein